MHPTFQNSNSVLPHYVDVYVFNNPTLFDNCNIPRLNYIDLLVAFISNKQINYELISRVKYEDTNLRLGPLYLIDSGDVHGIWGTLKWQILLLGSPLMNFNGM